jgi:long-chain acyl-CoA synthetase
MSQSTPEHIARVTVGDLLQSASVHDPEKEALIQPKTDDRLTYGELDDRANQLARGLVVAGCSGGQRLGILAGNSTEFLVTFFAAAKAGVEFVPVSTEMTVDDIRYCVEQAELDYLIYEDVYYEKIDEVLETSDSAVEPLAIIEWEGGADVELPTLSSFREGNSTDELSRSLAGDNTAIILFTSGTTSRPKGVKHAHHALVACANNWCYHFDIGRSDVLGNWLPFFHIGDLSFAIAAVHAGASMVVQRGFDPEVALDYIDQYNISVTEGIAGLYLRILDVDGIETYDLSSLRVCSWGLTMSIEDLEECITVFDSSFRKQSGQTEATTPTFFMDEEETREKVEAGNYFGKPSLNNTTVIMDEDGEILDRGNVGEIAYRGQLIMKGYLDEETTATVTEGGWIRSGDMGRLDADGFVEFAGRKKNMIKSGGENVSSIKVENVLQEHPSVAEGAIVGLPHRKWGEAVTAFVKPVDDADVSADAILKALKSNEGLANFETPKSVEIIHEFPRSHTGKVQKPVLAEEYEDYYM